MCPPGREVLVLSANEPALVVVRHYMDVVPVCDAEPPQSAVPTLRAAEVHPGRPRQPSPRHPAFTPWVTVLRPGPVSSLCRLRGTGQFQPCDGRRGQVSAVYAVIAFDDELTPFDWSKDEEVARQQRVLVAMRNVRSDGLRRQDVADRCNAGGAVPPPSTAVATRRVDGGPAGQGWPAGWHRLSAHCDRARGGARSQQRAGHLSR
jgi:hypothetical protein